MSRSTLWLKHLAEVSVIAAIAVVIHAQQTGPGGVPGGGGAAVSSVFGRTGAITAANGDYTAAQVTNAAATNAANTFTASQTIASGSYLELNGYSNWFAVPMVSSRSAFGFQSGSTSGIYTLVLFDGNGDSPGAQINGCYQYTSNAYTLGTTSDGYICGPLGGAAPVFTFGSTRNGVDGLVEMAAIGSGVSGNTDLRGHLTLSSGTATYAFSKAYTVAPTCVATDTTTAAGVQVTTSTTALALSGTGTDVINYICAD